MQITQRPRRLRSRPLVRNMVHEVDLSLSQLVQPYFIAEKDVEREEIHGFSGIYRWGVDSLSREVEKDLEKGLKNFLFFGASEKKDEIGSASYTEGATVPKALRTLRKRFGDAAVLITDVCLCSYTSHGHCGIWQENHVPNDLSVDKIVKMACTHAEAGADFVAPSDMMDGRIGRIRQELDLIGHEKVGVFAYTAKYASSYYGPFREALASSPQFSDRGSYQMDYRNKRDAMRELELDLAEGADIVMVKPALAYLDIIASFAEKSPVPVAAYSVSGEYEAVMRLVAAGMADERKMAMENLTAIRRAGAQILITYFASKMAREVWL